MKTVVDGNLVLVDDVVAIEKDRGKYKTYVADSRFHDVLVYENDKQINLTNSGGSYAVKPEVKYDPTSYLDGENGLTLEESAKKAQERISGTIFKDYSYKQLVLEGCKALIEKGEGRNYCYKLAGQVKKLREKGFYGDVHSMLVFHGIARGFMKTPDVTEMYYVPKTRQEAPKPVEYDPVYYYSGNNRLTVEESAKRATSEAQFILGDYSNYELVYEGALAMIKAAKGRQEVYKLAGAVKKGFYLGEYKGVTRSVVFNNIARGYMDSKVLVR